MRIESHDFSWVERGSLWRVLVGLSCWTLLLCVGGCAVKAPESQMLKVSQMAPDSWSASKAARAGVDREWVQSFGDSQLTALVAEAQRRSPTMRASQQRVAQARKMAYVAGAGARPTLALEQDFNRSKRQIFGPAYTGTLVQDSHSADLRVSWEPDLWGRVRMGQSAAIADAEAAELDSRAVSALLAADVCKAWFALGEASQQLQLSKEVVRVQSKSVEMIQERFANNLASGGGSASALRLAQTDLALAKASVAQREAEVQLVKKRLEILCGRYPAGKLDASKVLTQMPESTPAGLPSELLLRRPDVIAAERRYAAAVARVKEANRAIFPIIKLTGTGGSASDVLEDLVDGNYTAWSIGAGLTQNLLTGGRVLGEKQIRGSKELEELAKLEGAVLQAFGELESALVLDQWLGKRVQQVAKAEKLSKDAVASAQDDYVAGAGDALTLLTAQSRAAEVSAQLVALKRVRLENRVDLHLALGGEFTLKGK